VKERKNRILDHPELKKRNIKRAQLRRISMSLMGMKNVRNEEEQKKRK
jgi:hypothetical protein